MEKFDGLLRREKGCRHAAQLLLSESQKSLSVWTICQFGSNGASVFCLLWVLENVLLKMYSTFKQSQPLILLLPAVPLCARLPPSLSDIIIRGKLLRVMENWSIETEIRDQRKLCRSAQESNHGQCQCGSVRLSPSERVDPGDWVIERLVFEPVDSPNKLIPTPITNTLHHHQPSLH